MPFFFTSPMPFDKKQLIWQKNRSQGAVLQFVQTERRLLHNSDSSSTVRFLCGIIQESDGFLEKKYNSKLSVKWVNLTINIKGKWNLKLRKGLMISLSHLGNIYLFIFFKLIWLRVDLLGFVGVITLYDTRVVLQYSKYYFPPLPLQHESVCLKDRSHICTTQITEFKVC